MLFTEPVFLFLFLPLTLALYFIVPTRFRNFWLAAASLIFYAWGEMRFVPLMAFSITLNYYFALWIEQTRETRLGRSILAAGIASDLAFLIYFKYANFFIGSLNDVLTFYTSAASIEMAPILLPLGISFFTFHKISYKVDVYRNVVRASRSPVDLAMYILLFPQLIAGPIIRYHDIAHQIRQRIVTHSDFADGIRRFIVGFGKKMIIANTAARTADQIFLMPAHELSFGVAWLGILCYTIQIYFDFSGYSDMAIGLARMFGFRFPENFNYPYISGSITEFWKRWHISLSNWFRDYLYIPLGGNRVAPRRLYVNLATVFFFCGLWHGASWNFIVWGLFHGSFLVVERAGFSKLLAAAGFIRHAYALGVVMVGWVFFRLETLPHALDYLAAMFGLARAAASEYTLSMYLDRELLWTLAAGMIGSTPLVNHLWKRAEVHLFDHEGRPALGVAWSGVELAFLGAVFLYSVMRVAAGTYNPFIYFRF